VLDPLFRPRDRVRRLDHFEGMLDKIRCHLHGELPEEYRPNSG